MNPEQLEFIRPTNGLQHASFVSLHHDTYPHIIPTGTELAGRSILITGASKGIGKALAIRCVKAGVSKIAIFARSSQEDVIQELKTEASNSNLPEPLIIALNMDVTCKESVEAASKEVQHSFSGKLDILVNNAGYLPDMVRVGEDDPNEWIKGWDVNMKGPYLCCHFLMPMLLASELKTVINLTSVGAHCISSGGSSYQTARFAICRFTEFIACEYEKEGLIAIALHPGSIRTEMGERLPEIFDSLLVDTVELPADTIVWLARERREWLNARFVWGTWDMEELEGRKEEIVQRDLFKFRITV
ncbi:unnamed protein product [Penicillium salamii]|uniref:Uncharacterized protein n=1 Tax=Penicillium salamii TaxID=1612424 RepID=A0A9W4JRH8_9EURO|nr:unnamed protein product [Penicillium salamii]CAG8025734.1 unnamed protein product [Penicillium salamii]CAG8060820.1 unnamed protein product [Penicillium salamii]CAG8082294.1 unnamed protein product [Penicillium salamii]CAG8185182.1 unnamed protein product [Penicillium salamii]